MRAWLFSLCGHALTILLFWGAMTQHQSLGQLINEKNAWDAQPQAQLPQTQLISSDELDAQIAYITSQEQQYLKQKEEERRAIDKQLLDLTSQQQKMRSSLVTLEQEKHLLKQELAHLSQDRESQQEAYKIAQKKLTETEKKIKQLEYVQEVTAEVYQEKLKNDVALLQSYRKKVSYHLARYWNLPSVLAPDLRCQIRVKIIPNGEVVAAHLVQSSGHSVFDEHAIEAVYRASPLPVLDILSPQERPREIYMTFIPQDVTAVEAFS